MTKIRKCDDCGCITGPYEKDDEAFDGECGEGDEIVYGWALIEWSADCNADGQP